MPQLKDTVIRPQNADIGESAVPQEPIASGFGWAWLILRCDYASCRRVCWHCAVQHMVHCNDILFLLIAI